VHDSLRPLLHYDADIIPVQALLPINQVIKKWINDHRNAAKPANHKTKQNLKTGH
jgi:hypothetical protein